MYLSNHLPTCLSSTVTSILASWFSKTRGTSSSTFPGLSLSFLSWRSIQTCASCSRSLSRGTQEGPCYTTSMSFCRISGGSRTSAPWRPAITRARSHAPSARHSKDRAVSRVMSPSRSELGAHWTSRRSVCSAPLTAKAVREGLRTFVLPSQDGLVCFLSAQLAAETPGTPAYRRSTQSRCSPGHGCVCRTPFASTGWAPSERPGAVSFSWRLAFRWKPRALRGLCALGPAAVCRVSF